MFVVMRISGLVVTKCTSAAHATVELMPGPHVHTTVIGVFANKVDANKCWHTDRDRAAQKAARYVWRIGEVPEQALAWRPATGDTVHVLTQEGHPITCAATAPKTAPTQYRDLTWHTLKFGVYKPGIMADMHMHIVDASACLPENNKLQFH